MQITRKWRWDPPHEGCPRRVSDLDDSCPQVSVEFAVLQQKLYVACDADDGNYIEVKMKDLTGDDGYYICGPLEDLAGDDGNYICGPTEDLAADIGVSRWWAL